MKPKRDKKKPTTSKQPERFNEDAEAIRRHAEEREWREVYENSYRYNPYERERR